MTETTEKNSCREAEELINFIRKSPTAFHTVSTIKAMLDENGFTQLFEENEWAPAPGNKYYVIRNCSSIIAVSVGSCLQNPSFQITASHSDSPLFKVKENAILKTKEKYARLNTEGYGGMICSSWLDRPLSLAGRAVVKNGSKFESRLFNIDRDLLLIPNVAIHMNRSVNEGTSFNKQTDMLPLFSTSLPSEEDFKKMIADELGVLPEQLYGSDTFLYCRSAPSVWGKDNEFISSPRLDDLQCVFSSLLGFLNGKNEKNINVFACLDNEEVGSGTRQGAASTFLPDVLGRISQAVFREKEGYYRAASSGFMLSCDNAHAVHPNHPEKTDDTNCVYINEGIVLKSHAGQKYTSDAVGMAAFREICKRADVPVQVFANRSDSAGGSTLGNIAMGQISMCCVDVGLPQLAMHSSYETAGVKDTSFMIRAVNEFYNSHFEVSGDSFSV
ncbi:MAG: M18 family aminopeptidase [Eubacteriales bacterium]|nr:M18 family aminopeptidase [Eubacteriales bacterium]